MSLTLTTLILADDHPVFRRGLADVIHTRPDYRVTAEAENGAEALDLVREMRPDIAVLDVEMPLLNGIAVARRLQETQSDTAVIMLTMHRETAFFFQAMDAGVSAYVLKDTAIRDLLDSIARVREGGFYLSNEFQTQLLEHRLKKRRLHTEQRGFDTLTPTERTVISHIAQGKTTREVAEDMVISPRTVEHHRSSICRKLDLTGTNALLRFVLEHRLEL